MKQKSRIVLAIFGFGFAALALYTYMLRDVGNSREAQIKIEDKSTNQKFNPIVEKSLVGLTEGKKLDDSLSMKEYDSLREELKKTDHGYLERQALKDNEKLQAFRKLYYKILKKPNEVKDYQQILTDSKNLQTASLKLNESAQQLSASNQVERMLYVDFLSEAIKASKTMNESPVHALVQKVVKADLIFDKSKSVELRKSLYVDRMELFRSYFQNYPDKAAAMITDLPKSKYRQYLEDIIKQGTPEEVL